eukprot:scaffold587_cov339-Pavlova_lutheri.AAC.7
MQETAPRISYHRREASLLVKNEPLLRTPTRPRASYVRQEPSPRSYTRPHQVHPRMVYRGGHPPRKFSSANATT